MPYYITLICLIVWKDMVHVYFYDSYISCIYLKRNCLFQFPKTHSQKYLKCPYFYTQRSACAKRFQNDIRVSYDDVILNKKNSEYFMLKIRFLG